MIGLIKKVIGGGNEREIKRLNRIVDSIRALEPKMEAMSDDELRGQTSLFKERYENGESLDKMLPEAFAVTREASKRVIGMRHFDVQMLGGIVLHQGRVAEMRTGEGKTLVATLPAYLNAIAGQGVHVITANDYLARRDSEWMGQVHRFLGLTVGLNVHGISHFEKQEAYRSDITYGTNNEFGFDYLRDNMVGHMEEMVQRPLFYVVVDEVDSILIDEARTPLIISGPAEKSTDLYFTADLFVRSLKEEEDYQTDEKAKSANLTEAGVHKAERYFRVSNLFDPQHSSFNHHIMQALKAHAMMKRDKDYVVQGEEVIIVDEFTGRMMQGRRYSDGLHQAIEAKEGVKVQNESKTLATITLQNYFRMYKKLSGMTGTAKTEEQEFIDIYGMDVVTIPPNRPNQRKDGSDVVYKTVNGKFSQVVNAIEERHKTGQPVLVGTTSVEKSEILAAMLKRKGIKHQVLNAKYHEREAEIVSHAGGYGMVTIATNMAGRGTDILLGDGVADLGGLHIIGTERHESRRIDNQLRGRAGRQGDPGSSQFYLSLEDDLMRMFGSDKIMGLMNKLGIEEDQPIENKMVTQAIERAQRKVEANNYDIRKHVLKYDDVMNKQREVIYRQRRQIIQQDHLRDIVVGMMRDLVDFMLDTYCIADQIPEDWDIGGLIGYGEHHFLTSGRMTEAELRVFDRDELRAFLYEQVEVEYQDRESSMGEVVRELERMVLLQTVDNKWMDHIDAMEMLRQGIHLRGYGQMDPLTAYQQEGYEMFESMIHSIREEVTMYVFKAQLSYDSLPETPQPLFTSS